MWRSNFYNFLKDIIRVFIIYIIIRVPHNIYTHVKITNFVKKNIFFLIPRTRDI